jgi:hypothetical protein
MIEELKKKLTPEFMETLAQLIEYVNWDVDMIETMEFYLQICHELELEPRKLDGYH